MSWKGCGAVTGGSRTMRDETMGEDRGQMYQGQAAQALAALRNGLLSLLRSQGVTRIADALRHHGSSVEEALALIGVAL